MVAVSLDDRARLLAAEPQTYYLTEHYASYPAILVRLSQISHDSLRDLLTSAREQLIQQSRRRRRTAK
jgi:hypothetical protein